MKTYNITLILERKTTIEAESMEDAARIAALEWAAQNPSDKRGRLDELIIEDETGYINRTCFSAADYF